MGGCMYVTVFIICMSVSPVSMGTHVEECM